MTLAFGWLVVFIAVIGGFAWAGGNPTSLFVGAEWSVVGGCAIGYIVASSPKTVLKLLWAQIVRSFRGSPYTAQVYTELVQMLYEIFRVGRQQGIISLETHVLEPLKSPIVGRYPSFLANHDAIEFFSDAMKPVIDGKLKADQLKISLDEQINSKERHAHGPVTVLNKVADALPGLGIVAAVMGIIITMAHIAGDVSAVGEYVAHALVGTFLGVFLCYGIVQPLSLNMEFLNEDELSYLIVIRSGIVAFASGSSPMTAAESMRNSIPKDRRIGSEDMETLLKSMKG